MEIEEKEKCPRCGQKFLCSKSNKCWCYEIGLDSNQLEKLNKTYESCICPDCIEELKNQNRL